MYIFQIRVAFKSIDSNVSQTPRHAHLIQLLLDIYAGNFWVQFNLGNMYMYNSSEGMKQDAFDAVEAHSMANLVVTSCPF